MKRKEHVLIIGAGAAGLMVAYELTRHAYKVVVLEARNRTGGRIYTLYDDRVPVPLELGAEFIHGKQSLTNLLLKEAGINQYRTRGEAYRFSNGKILKNGFDVKGWNVMERRLHRLKEDCTIAEFLEAEMSGDKYQSLRKWVISFAEGYDAADTTRASALALRDEWAGDDDMEQHRLQGGYKSLIDFLWNEILSAGGEVKLSSAVKTVQWKKGSITISTDNDERYEAQKVIVTVPLGVLQQVKTGKGSIDFTPAIPEKLSAVNELGYGGVIKILLHFKTPFWMEKEFEKQSGVSLKQLGFMLSDCTIPTWWTQLPLAAPVLTGWLGGPRSMDIRDQTSEEIARKALESLSAILQLSINELEKMMVTSHLMNWNNDPFSLGAYAYNTIPAKKAIKQLNDPVEETIYFAGEGIYEGKATGTVEAALVSGLNTAKRILKNR